MSDKKLLAENTIRRFMKLANVDSLTETFLDEGGYGGMKMPAKRGKRPHSEDPMEETLEGEETIEEEESDEAVEALYEQDEDELEDEEDLGADEDELGMDDELEMGDDMDMETEVGAADMSLTEEEAQLLIDLGERLKEAMGGLDDAGADDMEGMDDMEDMEGMEPEEPAGEEEEEVDEDELVNEVLKRVTKRLISAKLRN